MKEIYFVVSDVHSFYDELQIALQSQGFEIDNPSHKLVVCGDLFDRGLKTREVFNFCKSLGDRFIYIKGNHEDLLEDCVSDIVSGRSVGSHHFSNGTVRTIAAFCDMDEWEVTALRRSEEVKQHVFTSMQPVLDFISSKALNYCELGDYIFVHGWIPTISDDDYFNPNPLKVISKELWDDTEDYSIRDAWKQARWTNGMRAWKAGCSLPGKTIVCGHWHVSYAWSHIEQKYKEFPPKNRRGWQKSFQPYIKDGIMALDACTAYSGFINCVKLEVEVDV